MFPHEAQALMAKILFFVFATCIICLRPVNSAEINSSIESQTFTSSVASSIKP